MRTSSGDSIVFEQSLHDSHNRFASVTAAETYDGQIIIIHNSPKWLLIIRNENDYRTTTIVNIKKKNKNMACPERVIRVKSTPVTSELIIRRRHNRCL